MQNYLRSTGNWCSKRESCASVGKVNQSKLGFQKNSLQEDETDMQPNSSEQIERVIHPKNFEAELIHTKKTMQMKN